MKFLKPIASYLKRHSPTILTVAGAIGVVATAITAGQNAVKAHELACDESEKCEENGEGYFLVDLVRTCWKSYIPTALVGVSTIVCIFGANILNRRQQASLASAYALLSQSYVRYRKAANEVYGKDADSNIEAQVAKDIYISADGKALYIAELDKTSDKCLFYDMHSNRYFTSTLPAVIQAEYHLNRNFVLKGEVSVNEFYEFLGLKPIAFGDEIGWGNDLLDNGIMWIDFENRKAVMDDGMECYIISSMYKPTPDM